MLRGIFKIIARPLINYLIKPAIRHKYLPKFQQLMQYNRKEAMLGTCLEYAHLAGVKGDYLEFGTWKGDSMIAAYHLSQRFDSLSEMKFYGFDSFQGIPTLTVNESEAREFPPGTFAASLADVRRSLELAGVDMKRVELIPGWYSDTLNPETRTRLPIRTAAVVNIDCDVFESTVSVLDFVQPYLADGSIVIFDDWYCFANRDDLGEQKAFREWLARNRQLRATPYKEFGWDGKAFIINRNATETQVMVSATHEYLSELVNDSVIIRTVEGRINSWNRSAEDLYGWSKEEAIGHVTHNLLRTEFPKALEEIESELLRNGRWEGTLVHSRRDGGRVVVKSRWTLTRTEPHSEVLEINRRSTDFNPHVSGFDAKAEHKSKMKSPDPDAQRRTMAR